MRTMLETANFIASTFTTLFYFTKSDIKTTLIPITIFAAASTSVINASKLPHIIFWIWIHLLQFDVSNQSLDEAEDTSNKADRPIPSGRMTLHQARVLRWILVPVCFTFSFAYSFTVLLASLSLVFFTVVYNELRAHAGHWLLRNVVNAAGFMSFEAGATLVAGQNHHTLDDTARLAIVLSGGIFATTIHAQDFKDTEGDGKIGRHTIPLVMPAISRFTVIVPVVVWSVGLARIWNLDSGPTAAFIVLATFVGARFLMLKTVPQDQVSFYFYNLWLSIAHALPAYWRYMV